MVKKEKREFSVSILIFKKGFYKGILAAKDKNNEYEDCGCVLMSVEVFNKD